MTELEKIERAKMYMEKLANGINPIEDTAVPDEDVINNVRLSRCFFFVSDVLRQVLDNGGIKPAAGSKGSKKAPFSLPFEKRAQFDYSEKPIPVSEIAKRVNSLIDTDSMKKLSHSAILTWLIEIGMMEWSFTGDGKRTKRPTKFGAENGILIEERMGGSGPYQVVVYNREAQRFVIDNLDAIIAAENMGAPMHGAAWTKEQDDLLTELYRKALPISEIAVTLKRNSSAVVKRIQKLELDKPEEAAHGWDS